MTRLHEDFMDEILEIRAMFGGEIEISEGYEEPEFEYDIAANTLFVFNDIGETESVVRMNYIPENKMYAVDVTEFVHNCKTIFQSGYFSNDCAQLEVCPEEKGKYMCMVEIVCNDEEPVADKHYSIIRSAMEFYRKVFTQFQYT